MSEWLERIRVASPCSAAWEEMSGDDRVRFCAQCRKNVYNLSALSRAEAETLVLEKEGRICARFHRRRDGTLLTQNCPVGLRRMRRWLVMNVGGIAAAFGLLALLAPLARAETFQRLRHSRLAEVEPFRSFFEWIDPTPVIMGDIAMPPPPGSTRGA